MISRRARLHQRAEQVELAQSRVECVLFLATAEQMGELLKTWAHRQKKAFRRHDRGDRMRSEVAAQPSEEAPRLVVRTNDSLRRKPRRQTQGIGPRGTGVHGVPCPPQRTNDRHRPEGFRLDHQDFPFAPRVHGSADCLRPPSTSAAAIRARMVFTASSMVAKQ